MQLRPAMLVPQATMEITTLPLGNVGDASNAGYILHLTEIWREYHLVNYGTARLIRLVHLTSRLESLASTLVELPVEQLGESHQAALLLDQ